MASIGLFDYKVKILSALWYLRLDRYEDIEKLGIEVTPYSYVL